MSVRFYLFLVFSILANTANANDAKVEQILSSSKTPAGIVFEIASSDSGALKWAIPKIKSYAIRLRKKFPELEIAVVTHGREQFALQKTSSAEYQKVHKEVELLAKSENIPVHVCQTFASWNGVEPEDFPDYVSVSTTGPQQVNDYVDLGYTLIKIYDR